MKRKKIIYLLLILLCLVFYPVYRHYTRIENRVLKNVAFNHELHLLVQELHWKHDIRIVLEGFEFLPSNSPDAPPRISYSAGKTTVRQLLDTVVPQKEYVWTTDGKIIHIISRALASRPDYQMNAVIDHFSMKDADYKSLTKSALALVKPNNVSEPLVLDPSIEVAARFTQFHPSISIDIRHATLREVLDQIAQETGCYYMVVGAKGYSHSPAAPVPYGSHALWLILYD